MQGDPADSIKLKWMECAGAFMRAWIVVPLLLLVSTLGGCLDDKNSESNNPDEGIARGPQFEAQVVVAVIDSAVNPYHEGYHVNHTISDAILETLVDGEGRPPIRVQLSNNGTWEERRQADDEFWSSIEEGRVYYFEGTRLLALSFGGNIIDGGSHGTGTTSAVMNANPGAIVVLAQGTGSSTAEQWAANTPWVDILSESYGLYCGQPALELLPIDSTAKNNKVAWEHGKIPMGAADNTPCPAMNDGTSGPPWVVGISGDHPAGEQSCREPISGNFPDFTADFTQDLPYGNNLDEYSQVSGTSFSTPTAAGAFSKALLMVREAWGHKGGIQDGALAVSPTGETLTHIDLRDAFNHTAVYFATATTCGEAGSVPVNPAAPWVQMGWGHLDASIGELTGRVLLGEDPLPAQDPNAKAYMEAVYAYREQAWNAVA